MNRDAKFTRDEKFEIDLAFSAMQKQFEANGFAGSFAYQLDAAAEYMQNHLAARQVVRKVSWTTAEKVAGGVRVEFQFRPVLEPETRAGVLK